MSMEPTNRLRWVKRYGRATGEEYRVLQVLWVEVAHIPPGTRSITLTYPGREEWRDVPTEEG